MKYRKFFNSFIKYFFIVFFITALGLVFTLGYYYYTNENPPEDTRFDSIVKSISEVQDDETLYVKVKIDEINVRRNNVVTNGNVIGKVEKNDIYKVETIKRGDKFYWYYIVDKDGNKGYIPSGYDIIFIDTFKLKKSAEQELSLIQLENKEDETTTTVPVTTEQTTTTVTTNNQKTTTKTTKAATTKKTQVVTKGITTYTSDSTYFKYSVDMDNGTCSGTSCEHYLILKACAYMGADNISDSYDCDDINKYNVNNNKEYKYIIRLYKNNNLIKQNSNYSYSTTAIINESGEYTAVFELVGANITRTMDIEVPELG